MDNKIFVYKKPNAMIGHKYKDEAWRYEVIKDCHPYPDRLKIDLCKDCKKDLIRWLGIKVKERQKLMNVTYEIDDYSNPSQPKIKVHNAWYYSDTLLNYFK